VFEAKKVKARAKAEEIEREQQAEIFDREKKS